MLNSVRSMTILTILPFLTATACDQQPTHYRQLPAYQPSQPVYVQPTPVYGPAAAPSTIVIQPLPTVRRVITVRQPPTPGGTAIGTVLNRQPVAAPLRIDGSPAAGRTYTTPTRASAPNQPPPNTLGDVTGVNQLQDRGTRPMNAPIGAPPMTTRPPVANTTPTPSYAPPPNVTPARALPPASPPSAPTPSYRPLPPPSPAYSRPASPPPPTRSMPSYRPLPPRSVPATRR